MLIPNIKNPPQSRRGTHGGFGAQKSGAVIGSGFFTLDDSVDGFAFLIALNVGSKDVDEALAGLEALPAHVGDEDDVVEVIEGIVLPGGFSFP